MSTLHLVMAFAAVYVIWGSTYLAIRIAIDSLPPFLMAGVRFVLAGALLYAWARWRGTPAPTRTEWRSAAVVGTLLLLGGNGLVTWAELIVPSGLAAVLVAMVPLWIAVLDRVVFGSRSFTRWVGVGLVLGLTGVLVLVDPTENGVRHVPVIGAVAILVAAGSWALGSLLARGAALPAKPSMAAAAEMLTGGAALMVVGTAAGEWTRWKPADTTSTSAVALIYLVIFGSVIALSAYNWLLRNTSATAVGTYAFVNPVVAVILGWLILGEPLTARTVFASTLIVGAVVVLQVSRARSRAPVTAPPSAERCLIETSPARPAISSRS